MTEAQVAVLAAKGIGPNGNKVIPEEVIKTVLDEIFSGRCEETLSGVLLAALRVLPMSLSERNAFNEVIENKQEVMSDECKYVLSIEQGDGVFELCNKLNECLELSKKDCDDLVEYLCSEDKPKLVKGYMLQGLRLKRETLNENIAFLNALKTKIDSVLYNGELLLDLAEPYDGHTRTPNLSLCLSMLLAEMGYANVLHGQKDLGPKFGETVFSYFPEETQFTSLLAIECIEQTGVGIIETDKVCSELISLRDIRNAMRKRSILATVDKLLAPVRCAKRRIQVVGYVHSAYQTTLSDMMLDLQQEAIIIKGIEGGVMIDPMKATPVVYVKGDKKVVHEYKNKEWKNSQTVSKEVDLFSLLRGEHSLINDIAYTAVVLKSILVSNIDFDFEMKEALSLFQNGALEKRFNHFLDILNSFNNSGNYEINL